MLRRSERIKARGEATASASYPTVEASSSKEPVAIDSTSSASAANPTNTALANGPAFPGTLAVETDELPFSLDFDSDAPGQTPTPKAPFASEAQPPGLSTSLRRDIHPTPDYDSDALLITPSVSHSERSSHGHLERTPTPFSPTNLPDFNSGDAGYVLAKPREEMSVLLNIANHKLLRRPAKRALELTSYTSSESTGADWQDVVMKDAGQEQVSATSDSDSARDLEDDEMGEVSDTETIKGAEHEASPPLDASRELRKCLRNPLAWPERYDPAVDARKLQMDKAVVTLLYKFKPESDGYTFDFGIGHYWWRCLVSCPVFHVVGAFPNGSLKTFVIQRAGVEVMVSDSANYES